MLDEAEAASSVAGVGVTGVAASVEADFFLGSFAGRFEVALADVEASLASAFPLFAGGDDALVLLMLSADPQRSRPDLVTVFSFAGLAVGPSCSSSFLSALDVCSRA